MSQPLEYTQIYKFWASLGVGCFVAAATIPWVVSQQVAVLLVKENELDDLTPTGRRAIELKMATVLFSQEWVWLFSIFLILLGLYLLARGIPHWNQRQAAQDEREDLERDNLRPEEKVARAREDYAEAVSDEVTESMLNDDADMPPGAHPSPTPTSTPQNADNAGTASAGECNENATARTAESESPPEPPQRHAPVVTSTNRDSFMRDLHRTEHRVSQLAERGFGLTHEVRRDARLSLKGKEQVKAEVDLLIEGTKPGAPNYAIDIKLSDAKNLSARVKESAFNLAAVARVVRRGTDRETVGLLILVIRGKGDVPLSVDRRVREIQSVLSEPVGVMVFSEAELDAISPDEFRTRIERESSRAVNRFRLAAAHLG